MALIVHGKAPSNPKSFVNEIYKIMLGPVGARAAVYDADKEDYNNSKPTDLQVIEYLRNFWLTDITGIDDIAEALDADTFINELPERVYPPKDIETGELEYYRIKEPSNVMQTLVPFGVRRVGGVESRKIEEELERQGL